MKTTGFMSKGMALSSVCLLCVCIILVLAALIGLPGATAGENKANKPMVKGSLTFGKAAANYNDGVAVSGNFYGEPKTIVYLTDKLVDRNKVVEGLLKDGSYGEGGNRLELTFNSKGNLTSYFFYVREGVKDLNVGKGAEGVMSETTISKSRAKGMYSCRSR